MTTQTREYTPTETDLVLADMLTENTGRHMLDSGGAYGRNWERNAGKVAADFYAADPVRIEIWDDEFEGVTLDLFHWLRERVDIDTEWDNHFHEFAKTMPEDGWMQVVEAYVEHLRNVEMREVGGLYGEGDPFWVNTYNGEDALSQTIQYFYLSIDDEEKALIQIHGGCDVRGGYTAPRMFTTYDEYMLFDNANLYASTHHPDQEGGGLFELERVEPVFWDSDNAGYSWASDGVWSSRGNPEPEWEIQDGKVIYTPWGTEVYFSGR